MLLGDVSGSVCSDAQCNYLSQSMHDSINSHCKAEEDTVDREQRVQRDGDRDSEQHDESGRERERERVKEMD